MADKKISQLAGATTPLAGTEVLPIVQNGATVRVANNDLRPKQIQSNATTGVLQVVGPTAGTTRVMTTPDVNFTVARIDGAQNFAGNNTFDTTTLCVDAGNDRVGIGTATPQTRLDVSSVVGTTMRLSSTADKNTWSVGEILTEFQSHGADTSSDQAGVRTFIRTVNETDAFGQNWALTFGTTTFNSAATEKVRISSTGNLSIGNGNLVIGTSGKGIDFSATGQAAGMTSELLNDYEEGTWTPVDSSGAGLTLTTSAARYTKIGRTVFVQARIVFPSTVSAATVLIGGLPFTSSANSRTGLSLGYNNFAANYLPFVSASSTLIELFVVAGSGAQATNVNLSTQEFAFSGFYTV